MTVYRNSFDGGVAGQTVTVANSGGTSGDAFYAADALVYASSPSRGQLSASSSFLYYTLKWYCGETFFGPWYLRSYIYTLGLPSSPVRIHAIDGGSQLNQYVNVRSDGALELFTKASETPTYTSLGTTYVGIATNQWVRVETMWDLNGPVETRLFNNADSVTPTASVSGTLIGLTAAFSTANFITPAGWWVDDVAVSDQGWIGPTAPPPSEGGNRLISPAASHRASRW
ncbi:hypothetical protein ABZ815_20275 [Nonomuraea sp. NPDC047529]|uniref:hypothetical protein n=1 Tax=Nonomuraea sp. NPDC047529 TaxID=3155623 RepID=UPI0034052E2B